MKCVKKVYLNAKRAAKALAMLKPMFPNLTRYYPCPNCGGYHLTSAELASPLTPIHTPEMIREVKAEYVESRTYARQVKRSIKRRKNRAFWK